MSNYRHALSDIGAKATYMIEMMMRVDEVTNRFARR
jgi:hypothetical protein